MRLHPVLLLLLAAIVLAQACSTGDDGDAVDTDIYLDTWVLADGEHDGAAVPLVEGHRITLVLEPGTVGGTAACNQYGGDFASDGRSFEVGMMFQTEMGCEPDVMASEQAYLAALGEVQQISLDGEQLLLTGPSTLLRYDRVPPVQDADLVGTVWELDTILTGDAASSVMGDPATLLLRPDGRLEAGTGCRTLTGRWTISGDVVGTPELSADGDCPPDLAGQDGHVVEVLGDGFQAVVEGDRLTLTSVGGMGLSYRRAAG